MNKLELLSPAGDIDIFKAVVNAGADAVYFGGDLFGARAYAKNFTIQEAAEAISYAHFHGAKAYLTVNTLLKNLEIEKNLYSYLKAYVESGIDAFIVQDFGVVEFIKTYFPDTAIHASTQMSLCTKDGARFLEEMGACRIVTARELSINEIATIHGHCPELEIESFIHGALCVCYSGQCLMSSILGGRSGNRGRCAQPCRLPYKAFEDNGRPVKSRGDYLLSPKDFCTINYLPHMIEAGVMSFKIEGRMKQLSYATGVVSVYRKYIDQYLYKGADNYSVTDADIQRLLDYGNRSGFTDLYLKEHNGPSLITFEEPSHTKANTKDETFEEKKINLNCKIKALLGKPFEITFYDDNDNSATACGNIIEESKSKPASREDILKSASQLGGTGFVLDKVSIDYDDGIFLPVSVIKKTRREAIELLEKTYSGENIARICEFTQLERNHKNNITDVYKLFVSVSDMEQLDEANKYNFVASISVPIELFSKAEEKVTDKALYVTLPTVIRDEYLDNLHIPDTAAGLVVCSFDGLGLVDRIGYPKEKVILDHRLYTFSNRAISAYENAGFIMNCIPVEISIKELMHRDNSKSQLIVYSRLPLMVTANCTMKNTKGCNKSNKQLFLQDRKNENHLVKCNCTYCYNTIYNSKKYMAFDLADEVLRLGALELRMDFSLESANEVAGALKAYKVSFIDGAPFKTKEDYTKGHLKRGIE